MKLLISLLFAFVLAFSNELGYKDDTTCFVRNFKVAQYPEWASKIVMSDKKEYFFSSPKSMFEFYLHPSRWESLGITSEDEFGKIYVTDYESGKVLDARGAFFVYGSRGISPAGDDLPAFESYQKAEEFAKQYSGKRVFGFKEVSLALINLLNGRI